MQRRNAASPAWLSLSLAVPIWSGCELLERWPWDYHSGPPRDRDASRADAGVDAEAGTGTDAAEASSDAAPEAELDATADAAVREADACGGPDADPDACEPGSFPPSCDGDEQCAPDQYCSRASGSCRARCNEDGACVGPEISTLNNWLVSDGEHVCYVVPARADDESRYLVQSWDGVAAEPSTIGRGTDVRVLLVADGYCYFSGPSLERASVHGGDEQLVQKHAAAVRRAWSAPEYVWWTAPSDGGFDVYRLARTPGASAELFTSAPPTHLWEAGNSTHLFRRAPAWATCSVVMAPIDDLTAEVSIPMSFSRNCGGMLSADEQSVFFNQYEPINSFLFRIDLADPARQIQTRLVSHAGVPVQYQQHGAFLYGSRARDSGFNPDLPVPYPFTVTFHRVPRFGEPSSQLAELVFAPEPATARTRPSPAETDPIAGSSVGGYGNAFALLGTRLVYLSAQEPRLLVAPLPGSAL